MTEYLFQEDGTARISHFLRYRVLNEMGRQAASQPFIAYASASEEAAFETVRTVKPDGRILDADPSSAMEVSLPITQQAPQFSDLKAKVIVAPSVEVGDAVEFRASESIVHPLKPGDFWAVHTPLRQTVVDEEVVTIDVPSIRSLEIRWDPKQPPQKETKDGRTLYRWTLKNPEPAKRPREMLRPLFVASTLSTDRLAAWYVGLQADRGAATPELRAEAERLTAGLATPRQKLEALYAFVASSIRYVSVSFGIGGYQPHPPADVLRNRYGDCKDKDLLLRTLLATVGIDSRPALVNSELGTPEPRVGAPSQFNHVMTVAFLEEGPVWMDATSGLSPLGVLYPGVRGGTAILAGSDGARVLTAPLQSPMPDRHEAIMTGKLDAVGKLSLDTAIEAAGSSEVQDRVFVRYSTAETKKLLTRMLAVMQTGDFGATVEGLENSDPVALGTPFSVRFHTSAPGWLGLTDTKAEKQLPSVILRARVAGWDADAIDDAGDGEPIRLGDPGETRERMSLDLDPSYAMSPPAPVRVERRFAVYESVYSMNGRTLSASRSLRVLLPELPQADRGALIDFQKLVLRDLDQKLALRRTAKPDLRQLAGSLDADALNGAGTNAIDDGDYGLARDLLLKATEKDPKHKWAWNNLARAYIGLWDYDAAERAALKQIEINPKDEYAYNNLGSAYWSRGDLQKAEAQFRKQLEINPLDAFANGNLGEMLGELGKWNEAVKSLERAVQVAPTDTTMRVRLAIGLVEAGRVDDARAMATELLNEDIAAPNRLSLARMLAEKKIDLERADTLAAEVMKEAASACRGVSLDRVPDGYWESIALLTGAYEVQGVVAAQKGDLDRAVAMLRTGYDMVPSPTTAVWLARAYARKGESATGLRYYAHATRFPKFPKPPEIPEELREYAAQEFKDAAALRSKLAELGKERMLLDRVVPENGDFVVPKTDPGNQGVSLVVRVLVDENGRVEDARAEGGADPFRSTALADVRRLRFKPLGTPEAPIKSLRGVEFFYLPGKEVRAFWHFLQPPESMLFKLQKARAPLTPTSAGR